MAATCIPDSQRRFQSSLLNLSITYRNLGDFESALRLNQELVDIRARLLESAHPDLLRAKRNLALVYSSLAKHEEAVQTLEEVLATEIAAGRPKTPQTQLTRDYLGQVLYTSGDMNRALAVFKELDEVYGEVLPPSHQLRLKSRGNIALALKELGSLQEAIEIQREVLASFQSVLPDDHLRLQVARSSLAATLTTAGHYKEAARLERKAWEVMAKILS